MTWKCPACHRSQLKRLKAKVSAAETVSARASKVQTAAVERAQGAAAQASTCREHWNEANNALQEAKSRGRGLESEVSTTTELPHFTSYYMTSTYN